MSIDTQVAGKRMTEDILMLKEISDRLIAGTSLDFKRYLYPKIDWRNRFVCLKGAKGTGKTTILRQSMKERFGLTESVYYLSFDHLWFINHSALELVDTLYKNGIMHLFIDEVHHIDHWETVMKNIYDFYPGLQVAYSGSSILRMDNREGDLSRRQVCYDLKGLSFREYCAQRRRDTRRPRGEARSCGGGHKRKGGHRHARDARGQGLLDRQGAFDHAQAA